MGGIGKGHKGGTVCYPLSVRLAIMRQIIISDHGMGAPRHGKDVVDGVNAVEKSFLSGKTRMTVDPSKQQSDSKVPATTMIERAYGQLSTECYRLLSDPTRTTVVKSNSKSKKREGNAVVKGRKYWVPLKVLDEHHAFLLDLQALNAMIEHAEQCDDSEDSDSSSDEESYDEESGDMSSDKSGQDDVYVHV